MLDSLLFPYPRPLTERDPDEARTVRRLIKSLRAMQGDLIDSAKFDEEETIPEAVIRAFADIGMLGLTIPKKYGGIRARILPEIFHLPSEALASHFPQVDDLLRRGGQ